MRVCGLALLGFLAACANPTQPSEPAPRSATEPITPVETASREPNPGIEKARPALDAINAGAVSDSLLLRSMPQTSKEWSAQYTAFTSDEEVYYNRAYKQRLELAVARACSGSVPFARAVLLYGTFVDGEEAESYFYWDDTNEGDPYRARPDWGALCEQPETYCEAYEQLVQEHGADAMVRLNEVCSV